MRLDLPQVDCMSERWRCKGRSWSKQKRATKSQDQWRKSQVDLFRL